MELPYISRRPEPNCRALKTIANISDALDNDTKSVKSFDLRSTDVSKLNLESCVSELSISDFDTRTVWPSADKLPSGFSPDEIMEIGKDPGLNIRHLHGRGITGAGGICIIDQPLLTEHREYKDRLMYYEEVDVNKNHEAAMHGAAVASIAIGQSVGVAPSTDLYYFGCYMRRFLEDGTKRISYKAAASAVKKALELNDKLPPDKKIRVISISRGWGVKDEGYGDIIGAIGEAKKRGIFVVSTSLYQTFGYEFHGLGRESMSNPNQPDSFGPGLWWRDKFYSNLGRKQTDNRLYVPMDSRTTASQTGNEAYVFYRNGGWSWSVPYVAGMYMLACQVKPDITHQEFWGKALKTGITIEKKHEGKSYALGQILNPVNLIASLR